MPEAIRIIDLKLSFTQRPEAFPIMTNKLAIVNNGALQTTDSLSLYITEINSIPLLSREEEYSFAHRLRDHNDIDAAQALVTANLRYVVQIAYEFKSYGIALKDLIQEGSLGLMKAVKKFDPSKGNRLVTYASWWIRAEIQDFIVKTKGLVKRSAKAMKKKLFYKGNNDITDADNNPITTDDFSLDTVVTGDSHDSLEVTHQDMLVCTKENQEERVASDQEQVKLKSVLSSAVSDLNEKEKYIIENRVMTDTPMLLSDIGEVFSLSRERIRQIEKEALLKLKKNLCSTAIPLNP